MGKVKYNKLPIKLFKALNRNFKKKYKPITPNTSIIASKQNMGFMDKPSNLKIREVKNDKNGGLRAEQPIFLPANNAAFASKSYESYIGPIPS